ncbi:uncharacterized protein L969DRAFT_95251 [Mixia osmundae IAM 14324]|uniref:Translation initiation factor eIF2B subunit delta n=1 Tax=Mixia osmundae (strain CBS 9802 / IAM 14324 / JCM 22182 / KY 12970) TaxID=764103 RepID=G7E6Q2_MIXOS|nr:uncharacterized protein L969DRAFT_95251 [Mixia osmundae IAM 14324]KEI39107.1 hypothetical protein L969DRAFT_95251 [Mixia osmundae IAM 14324]GAA98512.1 hypothetical protein E5Q_05198 [Mixia osmundae IAM 14324]
MSVEQNEAKAKAKAAKKAHKDASAQQRPQASTSSAASHANPTSRRKPNAPPTAAQPGTTPASIAPAQAAQTPLNLFLHLDPPRSARTLAKSNASDKDYVHPAVVRLASQYADFKIVGANARAIAMLEAFKLVIQSYQPPAGTALFRHLPTHLSPQITHLVRARPLAVSMGNAIRWLKWEINQVGPDMPDEQAKAMLCERIDHFIRDRIHLAGQVIQTHALDKINDGDVILTYARSSLVEQILLTAWRSGKRFSVICVDSRPMLEGRHLLQRLVDHHIPATYVLIPSMSTVLSSVSLVLLGTSALLSDGAMFARAGTATVALLSKSAGKPVVCCCETYKFSDRIMLDSIVGNEMASPLAVWPASARSQDSLVDPPPAQHQTFVPPNEHLSVLNLLYDVSRPEDITCVVTEAAIIPVQSVPLILREFKPIMQS